GRNLVVVPRPREVTVSIGDLMERIERQAVPETAKLVEPPQPDTRRFVSTDHNAPEAAAPENARFESDRNTSAASRLQPEEVLPSEPLPTMDGTNPIPTLELVDRNYVDGALDEPAPPPPSPSAEDEAAPLERISAPSLPAPASEAPVTAGEKEENVFRAPGSGPGLAEAAPNLGQGEAPADLAGQPAPDPVGSPTQQGAMAAETASAADTTPTPANPDESPSSKAFAPEQRQNLANGMRSKAGDDAVDAEATPMGQYKKKVKDQISAKWHRYRQDKADFVTWGMLRLEFNVSVAGQVQNLRITKNEANAMLAEFTLKAIREADIPPMPSEVAAQVGEDGLAIHYDVIIY
ncbi:MAG TPA: hypothetical protein PLA50_14360, partial [Bacteroidia bacterium]|nr:hypothetical protein [Bacteroidia bacterium]